MAQRAARHNQQMMMMPPPNAPNGYMIPPHPAQMQGRRQSSPQAIPMAGYPQQRSPNGLSTSPGNQGFFHTMQPRSNNANLHPQQARRKISAQSNGTRFGPPSPTHKQQQHQQQRQRSPNRTNNRGNLGQQQYNYTDSRGRPLSMTDLRILEEVSRNPGYDRRRARSVEDLLAYDDGALSEISMGSGGTSGYTTGRKKRPGMWARSKAEQR